MRARTATRACVLACALALAGAARPYAVAIHELMPGRALAGERALAESLPAVSRAELDLFRTWLDARFRAHPDAALRAHYVKRWPQPAAFTALELKRLLSLNLQKEINGVDVAGGLPCTALKALQIGSGQPDTDWRNRERLALDPAGKPLLLPDGREVPADPLILNMGRVRGLSSQAHAHYGLPDVRLSSEPGVLRDDPRRFALAHGWPEGGVRTFAREMAQMHHDLGVLAMLSGQPAGRSLGHLFLGQGMHYLEDVGNQIHTVQVGYYDLLKRARVLTWQRALATCGGYLGELRPWTHIGIELLTTHHVISEALNAKRVHEAVAGRQVPEPVRAALDGLVSDDPELGADLARTAGAPRRAAAIVGCVIERSSHEGADVYRAVAGALKPSMSQYGVLVDDETRDPDQFLGDPANPAVAASLDALYRLHARGYRRVGTALRRLYAGWAQEARALEGAAREKQVDDVAARFLTDRLDALEAEEARLAAYLADPPAAGLKTVKEPLWLLWPLLPIAATVWIVRRRGRASTDK